MEEKKGGEKKGRREARKERNVDFRKFGVLCKNTSLFVHAVPLSQNAIPLFLHLADSDSTLGPKYYFLRETFHEPRTGPGPHILWSDKTLFSLYVMIIMIVIMSSCMWLFVTGQSPPQSDSSELVRFQEPGAILGSERGLQDTHWVGKWINIYDKIYFILLSESCWVFIVLSTCRNLKLALWDKQEKGFNPPRFPVPFLRS